MSVYLNENQGFGDGATPTPAQDIDNEQCNVEESNKVGSIPCLFLDRQMIKEERDKKWDSYEIDLDKVENKSSDPTHASYEA